MRPRGLPPSAPIGLAATAVVVALVLKTVADPDLWGHLAFGRLILTAGLPAHDPFSYSAGDAPWVNHEWLSEVAMYAVFRSAGVTGLVLLKSAMLLCMFAVVLAAMRAAGTGIRQAALSAVVIAIGGMASFVTIRPQMFTYPIFAVFLLAIVRADRGAPGLLWLTPVLTVLGSNLHGGIAAALAVLFFWGGARLLEAVARKASILPGAPNGTTPPRTASWVIAAVLLLQAPAALLTPYGLEFWQFVHHTVSTGLPEISEWQRPMLDAPQSVLAVLAVAVLAVLVALGRGVRRDPLHVAIMLLLIAAGLQARRHLSLALIGLAILGAPAIVATLRPTRDARAGRRFGPLDAAITAMAVAVLAFGIARSRCVRIDPMTTPQRAVAYLADAEVSGNLIVLFDWGLYAIWNLQPRVRVSMDGRATSVYPPEVLRQHVAFLDATPAWRDGLEGADVALLSPRFRVYRELAEDPAWRLAYEDATAGLFVRRGSPNDERLVRTPRPTPGDHVDGCFGDDQLDTVSANATDATTARWSDG